MIGIEFIRAHRKLVRIDAIRRAPLARAIGLDSPGVLVDFFPLERMT